MFIIMYQIVLMIMSVKILKNAKMANVYLYVKRIRVNRMDRVIQKSMKHTAFVIQDLFPTPLLNVSKNHKVKYKNW